MAIRISDHRDQPLSSCSILRNLSNNTLSHDISFKAGDFNAPIMNFLSNVDFQYFGNGPPLISDNLIKAPIINCERKLRICAFVAQSP